LPWQGRYFHILPVGIPQ